jgi:integrase/recombinase XerD
MKKKANSVTSLVPTDNRPAINPELKEKFDQAEQKKYSILDFIQEFIGQFISPQTRKAYVVDLQNFFHFLQQGGLSLSHPSQIKGQHFQLYRDHLLQEKYSAATVNRKLVAVRSFMKWCVATKQVDHNPLDVIKLPKVTTESPTTAFDDHEVVMMIEAPDTTKKMGLTHRIVLLLLFNLGLRRSELTNIKMQDFYQDRGHQVLKILGKGGKTRHIPLNEHLIKEISFYVSELQQKWQLEFKPQDYLLQSTRKPGSPLDGSTIFRVVEKYAKQLGIHKQVSPHSCRATAISHLLDTQRIPIRDVAIFAGHSNITTTERYDKRRKGLDNNASYSIQYQVKKA